jgi:hypothetical protein
MMIAVADVVVVVILQGEYYSWTADLGHPRVIAPTCAPLPCLR